nr:immunoglobulin heavy chain junction region [Macaca mulatta]
CVGGAYANLDYW